MKRSFQRDWGASWKGLRGLSERIGGYVERTEGYIERTEGHIGRMKGTSKKDRGVLKKDEEDSSALLLSENQCQKYDRSSC